MNNYKILREYIEHILNDNSFKKEKIIIYPNFQGADVPEVYGSYPFEILSVSDMIGNEPAKDINYFMSEKREYIQKIINDVNMYGLNRIPPVIAIRHPLLNNRYLIIDGNHRLGAFKIGKIPKIPIVIIEDSEIYLAAPDTEEWYEGIEPETISLNEAIQNNYDLNIYFNTRDLI